MIIAVDIRHLSSLEPSGIGRYTIEVLKRMIAQSPEDTFVLFASGTKETLQTVPHFAGKNVSLVKHEGSNRILSAKLAFTALTLDDVLGKSVDVWFFPNINLIKTHRPYALTIHDLSLTFFPEFFRFKDRLRDRLSDPKALATRASHLFAVSHNTAHNITSTWGIPQENITVTHLGVDKKFTPNEHPRDRNILKLYGIDTPYFFSLCTIEPRKNLSSLIEAYALWRDEFRPDHAPKLIIAGANGWKNRSVFSSKMHCKYAKDIAFLGFVPEKHKPTLYRHAQVFLFPSFFEGFGLPVAEALASGTPVIASFTGSIQEIGSNQIIYVDPYNTTDLVHALQTSVSTGNSQTILQTLDWDLTAQKTLQGLHDMTIPSTPEITLS